MNQRETEVINGVINRLQGHLRASPRVLEALADPNLRTYLDTWVVPALKLLVKEDRDLLDLKLAVKLVE